MDKFSLIAYILLGILVLYYLNMTEVIVILLTLFLVFIAYLYSQKEKIPLPVEYLPVKEHIRVTFTGSARQKKGSGNMAKEVLLLDESGVRHYPYHPLFLSMLRSFKNLPVFDETFGQTEVIMPIKGEVNIPLGIIVEGKHPIGRSVNR